LVQAHAAYSVHIGARDVLTPSNPGRQWFGIPDEAHIEGVREGLA
jgi:hypothetical protein